MRTTKSCLLGARTDTFPSPCGSGSKCADTDHSANSWKHFFAFFIGTQAQLNAKDVLKYDSFCTSSSVILRTDRQALNLGLIRHSEHASYHRATIVMSPWLRPEICATFKPESQSPFSFVPVLASLRVLNRDMYP